MNILQYKTIIVDHQTSYFNFRLFCVSALSNQPSEIGASDQTGDVYLFFWLYNFILVMNGKY